MNSTLSSNVFFQHQDYKIDKFYITGVDGKRTF